MNRNYQKVEIDVKQYVLAGNIVSSNVAAGEICNAIEFYNGGTETAYINSRPIPAGGAWSPPSHPGEADITKYALRFAGGGTPLLYVSRKLYAN
mgnify:CR=1 FL=1